MTFFVWWIGKPNSVPTAEQILDEQGDRLARYEFSNFRGSYTDTLDLGEIIEKVFRENPRLALQLSLMGLFGLRAREALSMVISESFTSENGNPCINVFRGTKGGKPRKIVIKDNEGLSSFRYLWDYSVLNDIDELCWPDTEIEEGLKKQSRLLHTTYKLRKQTFSGSSHSFRHSFASRMMNRKPEKNEEDSLAVSQELGHHRAPVTAVYIGNAERSGEDMIRPLLLSLLEEPRSPKALDRLLLLLKELLICRTKLAFSLIRWVSDTSDVANEYNPLELRAKILLGGTPDSDGNSILRELTEWIGKEQAKMFLQHHAGTINVPWLEKNVLAPFDTNLISN